MIGATASLAHYWRHLNPIIAELHARGEEVVCGAPRDIPRAARAVLVASWADARACRGLPLIYVEHGAGQTYANAPGEVGWPGGRGLDDVVLFVCPGEPVARLWRATYRAPAVSVGCPALDRHYLGGVLHGAADKPTDAPTTVAFTFHWNCGVAPEATPALPHYLAALPEIIRYEKSQIYEVIGHGHPRLWRRIERTWRTLGVEPVEAWEEVLTRADVLVADNTSALYEFAALDRPVVCLNAPWYRRDVEHGLRFWSHVPGIQVDEPGELVDAIETAILDPDALSGLRSRAADYVYAHRDGSSTARAVDAIQEVLMARQATRRDVPNEMQTPLQTMVRRLEVLGATAEEIQLFRESWDDNEAWTDAERERLLHSDDRELRLAITEARSDNDFHSMTPDEADAQAAADAHAAAVEAAQEDAWQQRAQPVEGVLAWVRSDPETEQARASAVLAFELDDPAPRVELISELEQIVPPQVQVGEATVDGEPRGPGIEVPIGETGVLHQGPTVVLFQEGDGWAWWVEDGEGVADVETHSATFSEKYDAIINAFDQAFELMPEDAARWVLDLSTVDAGEVPGTKPGHWIEDPRVDLDAPGD